MPEFACFLVLNAINFLRSLKTLFKDKRDYMN